MGKKHTPVSKNGLYHDVVYRLCSDIKRSNVKLYFDNLYNSLVLLQNLQKDGIWATGNDSWKSHWSSPHCKTPT